MVRVRWAWGLIALAALFWACSAQAANLDYWLGVEAYPLPDAVRAHLGLPEGQGLQIEMIAPNSPAAQAKLQRHDILLKADDEALREVSDLIRIVHASQGKKLLLSVVRAGKTIQIDCTPAKRPAESRPESATPWTDDPQWQEMMKWLEKARPGQAGQPPVRIRIFQQGALLPPGAALLPPLPENMTVTVTKQGDKPAALHVARGEEKWDVAENELDKLPAEVRQHVERLLGRATHGGQVLDFVPTPQSDGAPPQPRVRVEPKPPPGPNSPDTDTRLDEMNRQLEQLRKSIDDIRRRLPAEPAPSLESPKK